MMIKTKVIEAFYLFPLTEDDCICQLMAASSPVFDGCACVGVDCGCPTDDVAWTQTDAYATSGGTATPAEAAAAAAAAAATDCCCDDGCDCENAKGRVEKEASSDCQCGPECDCEEDAGGGGGNDNSKIMMMVRKYLAVC